MNLKKLTSVLTIVAAIAPALHATEVGRIDISPEVISDLERVSVEVPAHDSSELVEYEGVRLGDLLRKYGAPAGEDIRGRDLRLVAIITAADGYKAVFALPELDPMFRDELVLLADRMHGEPLPEKEGPYRLVVPAEGRHSRWVRQVASVELREVE